MSLRTKLQSIASRFAKAVGFGSHVVPGGYGDMPRLDLWGTQHQPSVNDLLAQYKADVYTCANLNAQVFASQTLRLYVTTGPGEEKTKRWNTRTLTREETKSLRKQFPNHVKLAQADTVDEIVGHPAMEVLAKPNEFMDMFMLLELTDLYCEIIGKAYWYKERGADGRVEKVWLVPPTTISAVKNQYGYVEYYSMGNAQTRVETTDIVLFTVPSLTAPYSEGRSPLQAGWNVASLEDKRDSYNQSTLDNKAMPAVILSPKEAIGRPEAERLEKKWSRKFRRGGNNGVLVMESAIDAKPLTQTNKDLEMYQMSAMSKEELANVFGVPVSLVKTADVNRANADAGHYQHARMAIKPRCLRFASRLNLQYAPDFDDRLLFAFDDPVPRDVASDTAQRTADLNAGVRVINEVRQDEGLPNVDWGDRPWLPFTVAQPDVGGNLQSDRQPTNPPPGAEDEEDENEDDKKKALAILDVLTKYWTKEIDQSEAAEKLYAMDIKVKAIKDALTRPAIKDVLHNCVHEEKAPKGAGPLPKGEKIAAILRSTFPRAKSRHPQSNPKGH